MRRLETRSGRARYNFNDRKNGIERWRKYRRCYAAIFPIFSVFRIVCKKIAIILRIQFKRNVVAPRHVSLEFYDSRAAVMSHYAYSPYRKIELCTKIYSKYLFWFNRVFIDALAFYKLMFYVFSFLKYDVKIWCKTEWIWSQVLSRITNYLRKFWVNPAIDSDTMTIKITMTSKIKRLYKVSERLVTINY
jgi:hypothetical protein